GSRPGRFSPAILSPSAHASARRSCVGRRRARDRARRAGARRDDRGVRRRAARPPAGRGAACRGGPGARHAPRLRHARLAGPARLPPGAARARAACVARPLGARRPAPRPLPAPLPRPGARARRRRHERAARRAPPRRGRARPCRAAPGRTQLPLPPRRDLLERLAIEWSHPRWLVERWAAEFGLEPLPAMLAANNEPGPIAVRANPTRTTRAALAEELGAAGIATAPGRLAPDALLIAHTAARLRELAAYREGRLAFQGEASQLVVLLLGVAPGAHVLDACAAPGGKTTYAAALAAPGGRVIALDVNAAGLRRLTAEAARLGVAGVHALVADARRPPLAAVFDTVLVDAPCSGLGTLRRHPELRWRRRPEDIPRLAALQHELLAGVAALVRPGGTLVYAVCTLAREENADVVAGFLDR